MFRTFIYQMGDYGMRTCAVQRIQGKSYREGQDSDPECLQKNPKEWGVTTENLLLSVPDYHRTGDLHP